jgi:hypothetical protein
MGSAVAWGQTACPQGIARDGVWLEFPDRSVLTRVLSDGRMAEMEFAHDGTYTYGYVTLPIGLPVEAWSIVNGYAPIEERETITYAGTPDPVPRPSAGVRFDGIETSRYSSGPASRFSVTAVVGAAAPVTIGGCTYTGLPIEVMRVDLSGGQPVTDSMLHLTELGLTIYLGFSEGREPAVDTMPLSISYDPPVQGGATPSDLAPPALPVPAPAPPAK